MFMSQVISPKKMLGKYYTPLELAQAITDWAITDTSMSIFDPAFGKASFLRAASNTLRGLGAKMPAKNLYGVEIDPSATSSIDDLFNMGANRSNFLNADFLSTNLSLLSPVPFDVIAGNPPFVRSNNISEDFRETAKQAMDEDGFELPRLSGYWAYFLFHSLAFLKTGGRLAMLLPSAFISSQYSISLRREISKQFQRAAISVLNHRWFPDAEESIVVLLAEGYRKAAKNSKETVMDSKRERLLASKIGGFHISSLRKTTREGWRYVFEVLPDDISSFLMSLVVNGLGAPMQDYFKIRIGVVTGDNDFFVIAASKAKDLSIPRKHLTPIVTTSRHLPGLCFLPQDFTSGNKENYVLVTSEDKENLSDAVKAYIKIGHHKGIDERYKCRNRKPWHLVRYTYVPDAFLHYMSSSLPHIVVNFSSATCTNSVLRLTCTSRLTDSDKEKLALASATSIAQLSFEAQGRSYGGGVLKLEPRRASRVILPKIPAEDTHSIYRRVDQLLRKGQKESAMILSDEFVLTECLGLKLSFAQKLRMWWQKLVALRRNASNMHATQKLHA